MDSEHDGVDWDRLDRYVCGAGSWSDRVMLAAWVDSDPNLQRLADTMRTIGRRRGFTRHRLDARVALRDVQRRLGMHGRAW